MATDNELRNIDRMLQYVDVNEKRMEEMGTQINDLRQANVNLNTRVTQLMEQMQMTALIGRGSGPTV